LTCIADSKLPSASRPGAPLLPPDPALIAAQAPGFDVEVVQQTASTNADLVERVRRAQPARPLLRVALHQTAGRGRHGRRWFASPGGALLFSLAVPMAADGARIAAATLACGIGVAEALRAAGAPAALKWPNDLLLDGRKLGGVLCELGTDAQGRRTLVVGVGVNLQLDAATRDSIGQPAASLGGTAAAAVAHEALIARLACAIAEALRLYDARGFVPLQPRYMALFAHRDAMVDLFELGVRVAGGRALGVDGEGRLLIDTGHGLRACGSGEVSLRLSP
jgi:BirA family biotin operon repressor/biotin-[acetyl-CoA-carboxylase] ligase